MKIAKHSDSHFKFINTIFSGRHSSKQLKLFESNKSGKHAKTEMIVYNPIYAKISTCIGSFAVATSFLAFVTLGKYRGTLASSDTARVAKYVLKLSEPNATITEFIPNTTKNIDFEVKNFEGEIGNITSQSEVKLKYKIIVELPETWNLPLDCKLYRVHSTENLEEVTLTNGESAYIEVNTTSVTHNYRLQLTWQSGHEEIYYQNLTDNINISVESEQID